MHAALRVVGRPICVGKDNAACAHGGADDTFGDDAVADGAGGLIAASADDGRAGLQAKCVSGPARQVPADLVTFIHPWQQRGIKLQTAQQFAIPAAPSHVEQ